MRRFPLVVCLGAACGSDGDGDGAGGGADAGAPDGGRLADAGLPPICRDPAPWEPGTAAFREATSDWGLPATGAQGVRLSVLDIDGDGFADLHVRLSGGADDFSAGGARTTWLLRNTGARAFEDVTRSSGLRQTRWGDDPDLGRPGDVVAAGDVDNDGDTDVFTATPYDDENSEVMLGDGAGAFSLGPNEGDQRWQLSPAGASFVDHDRDGFLDLWVVENADGLPLQDRLYRGDGAGAFVDVTADAGLETLDWDDASAEEMNQALGHSWGWSAAACDLDGDGAPELLASSYGRAPNHLWRARGDGTYENASVASGYAYDNRQDWSDNESARCYCQLVPDADDCAGVPPPTAIECNDLSDVFRWDHDTDREPWRLGGNSGATVCADVTNDGALDLVTGEIVHWDVGSSSDPAELLVNAGEADLRFDRPGNDATGLGRNYPSPDWNEGIMSHAVIDFDNDGWQDVYFGDSDYAMTRGRLYHQDAPASFTEVDEDDFFEHARSHGVAVADFDRDGDLDVAVGHSFARCDSECYETQAIRLFENLAGDGGNFVQIALEGAGAGGANRAAIGARVSVTAGGVTQTQEVDGGHGHYGAQRDLVLHFGLGAACEADVTVRWPDADLSTGRAALPAGYRFRWRQGEEPEVAP